MVAKKKRTPTTKANALSKLQKEYKPLLEKMQPGTQNYCILKHLMYRGTITAAEAVTDFHCYRLSARIADLRAMGVNIETQTATKKGEFGIINYAVYHLRGECA